MKVLLAGASGAIGLPLVQQLKAAGHDVTAIHRSATGRARLTAAGATPLQVDVLDQPALLAALEGLSGDAVISQLTSMKKSPMTHNDLTATNRLRTEGTANLLVAAERIGAVRFVTQSMVFGYGYGDFGGRVLTEDDEFAPPGHGRFEEHLAAMRSNEDQVLGATNVQGVALRYGLFYGPGAAGETLVNAVRRRRMPVIRSGGVQPWVHIEDAATATVAALERGTGGAAYNIVDDEPVSFSDLITATAAVLGAPRPLVMPSWLLSATPYARAIMTGGLRASNARARDELGWAPRWPTYLDGIATLVTDDPASGGAA
ncbi:NAD-dependent epimerase/dehydratase family protein [Ornithinimicrobium faecis]|uniref:NAD-dependent epimerase/dehydratase family protein n=1 Tax=Ornithinimicrobium faecis TaxID=2934158 RepID=UPI002118DAB1|nr:NAD(P)-dependent oxidoreductase [Ornithinimicrobium sp. HY1745]